MSEPIWRGEWPSPGYEPVIRARRRAHETVRGAQQARERANATRVAAATARARARVLRERLSG